MDDNNNREKFTSFITDLNTYKDASIPVILDPVNPKANETNSPAGQQETEAAKPTRKKGKKPDVLLPLEGHQTVRQSNGTLAFNSSTMKDYGIDGKFAKYGSLSYTFAGTDTPGNEVMQKKLVNLLINDVKNPRTSEGRKGKVDARYLLSLCDISDNRRGVMASKLAHHCKRMLTASVSGTKKIRGKDDSFAGMNVFDFLVYKNGQIYYSFAETYSIKFLDSAKMYLPEAAYKINPKISPNGWSLVYYIYSIEHMNVGKANEGIYSVPKLLANCPYIPKEAEVKKSRGSLNQKIIRPFYNALTSCSEMFDYGIVLPDGELAAESEEIKSFDDFMGFMVDYKTFTQCDIQIYFKVDPYQEKRKAVKKAIAEHMTDEELDRKAKEFNEVKKRAKSLEAKERRAKKKADNKPDD